MEYKPSGKHLFINLYRCDCKYITNFRKIRAYFHKVLKQCGIQYVRAVRQKYGEESITVCIFLAESHLVITTYPEHKYVNIDFWGCGKPNLSLLIKKCRLFFRPKKVISDNIFDVHF